MICDCGITREEAIEIVEEVVANDLSDQSIDNALSQIDADRDGQVDQAIVDEIEKLLRRMELVPIDPSYLTGIASSGAGLGGVNQTINIELGGSSDLSDTNPDGSKVNSITINQTAEGQDVEESADQALSTGLEEETEVEPVEVLKEELLEEK